MASVTAQIHMESIFDLFVQAGFEVIVHARPGTATIQLVRGDQVMQSEAITLIAAYTKLIEAEQHTDEGVSTEGASWAMDDAHDR